MYKLYINIIFKIINVMMLKVMIPVYDDGDDNTYMIIKYVGYARL